MADLFTHASVALLVKHMTGRRKYAASFVLGTVLPDLLSRGPAMTMAALHRVAGMPVSEPMVSACDPLHMPVTVLPMSLAVALLFVEPQRRPVYWNLAGGMALHLLVDLCQRHLANGYYLLWPLSDWDFELGLFGSEQTVLVAPVLVLAAALAWRRGCRGEGPEGA